VTATKDGVMPNLWTWRVPREEQRLPRVKGRLSLSQDAAFTDQLVVG
jgi:hypothetical protein